MKTMSRILTERWRRVSPQEFKAIVEDSKSSYEIYKRLGYKGNADLAEIEMRAHAMRGMGIAIDTSHLHQNKGPSSYSNQQSVMTHDESRQSRPKASSLRFHMIKSGREEVCEKCGQGTIWNRKPLQLDIDHIDGNPKNNELENLRFLCAMCHKQADTSSQSAYYTWMRYHEVI